MGKSAQILGKEFGLTSQEMNQLLKEQGFLKGEPGEYELTELGAQFATEKDFHRGPGGYARYNAYWSTRTWDDSIKEKLDVSPEALQSARSINTENRRARLDAVKRARAEADVKFRASRPDLFPVPTDVSNNSSTVNSNNKLNGWAVAGIGVGIAAAGYAIYKATPHIKKWWKEKVVSHFNGEKKDNENRVQED